MPVVRKQASWPVVSAAALGLWAGPGPAPADPPAAKHPVPSADSAPASAPAAADAPTTAPAPAPSPERVSALIHALAAPRAYDAREKAKEELAALGEAAAPALEAALGDGEVRVRRSACEILGRLRRVASAPRLVPLLQDADASVRGSALDALEAIGAPALAAVDKARQENRLPAAVADEVKNRPVQRAVEKGLNACISKDLGWGFYKDQFKDILALGPPAARVLVRLFTTPEMDYVFLYRFDDEANEARVRYRKQIVQRLAGEALSDARDPAVAPALREFIGTLADVDPLEERDPRHELYETTAFVLMKLGDRTWYERLKTAFLKASGARVGASGALEVSLAGEFNARQKQFAALSRLAMLQIKADDLPATEQTYTTLIRLATERQTKAALKVFDRDQDGKLDESEHDLLEETLDQGAVRGLPMDVVRELYYYRGVMRNAFYNLACTYAQMDRKPEALDSLKKAVRTGYEDADWIQRDRDLDAIKEEPDYKRLIRDLERKRQRNEERNP